MSHEYILLQLGNSLPLRGTGRPVYRELAGKLHVTTEKQILDT